MSKDQTPVDNSLESQRAQANVMQNANELSVHIFSQPTDFLKLIKKDFGKVDSDQNGFISAKESLDYSMHGNDLQLRKAATLLYAHGDSIAGLHDQTLGHKSKGDWPYVNGITRADVSQGLRLQQNQTILDKAQRGLGDEFGTAGWLGLTAINALVGIGLAKERPGWAALYAVGTLASLASSAGSFFHAHDEWKKVDNTRDKFKASIGGLY